MVTAVVFACAPVVQHCVLNAYFLQQCMPQLLDFDSVALGCDKYNDIRKCTLEMLQIFKTRRVEPIARTRARGCAYRLVLCAAALVVCRAAEKCDGSEYKKCFSATSAEGCCGEGWEINWGHGRCSKCGVGEYKAWIAGDAASNSGTKWNGYNNGHRHRCLKCADGLYQDKEACNACIQCNGVPTYSKSKCCVGGRQYAVGENCLECSTFKTICLKESRQSYALGVCTFTNSFSALNSLLPSTQCLSGFSDIACITNTRITFSLVPNHWISKIKDVSGDNKCKSIIRNTMLPVGVSPGCSNFQCELQPSNECFTNKNSLGSYPCDLIDQCVDMSSIIKDLDEKYDSNALANEWGVETFNRKSAWEPFSIIMRILPDMELTLFHNTPCLDGFKVYYRPEPNKGVFYDSGISAEMTKYFKNSVHDYGTFISIREYVVPSDVNTLYPQKLFFRLTHKNLKCSCEDGLGGSVYQDDLNMVQTCTKCETGQKLDERISRNNCISKAKTCVWCDANWHAPGDKSECVQCPPEKPYRPKTSKDPCRACFFYESWDTRYCNVMHNISIGTNMVIESYHDEFKLEIHSDALIVPRDSYRYFNDSKNVNMFRIHSCSEFAEDNCKQHRQYIHACTGNLAHNGNIFYVEFSGADSPMLWNDYKTAHKDSTAAVDVVREGQCRDCTMCTNGNYLKGCLITSLTPPHAIRPGVHYTRHEDNVGVCVSCEENIKETDQYYSHPQQPEMGCVGWLDGLVVTMPYDIKDCEDVKKTAEGYVLRAGCGKKDFVYWNNLDPNAAIATRECLFAHPELSEVPKEDGSGDLVRLTWSDYRESTTEIPYCPPKWRVKEECIKSDLVDFAGNLKGLQWNIACCELCDDCDFVYLKRSKDWRQCSGATTADTQSENCVDTCDQGFYEEVEKDENNKDRSVCKPCETCQ